MKKYGLSLGIFLLIILNDMGDTLAQLFMKKGLLATGVHSVDLTNFMHFISQGIGSWLLWLGIVIYALNFFLWVLTLTRVDLSVAMPLGSTSYIAVPIFALIFLGEEVGLMRWLGIVLIVAGMFFISQSEHPKEKAAHSGV